MVAKGLSGLVGQEVSLGFFNGFKFGNGQVVVSHLQYVDDSILVGEASFKNMWEMKTILSCFELVSGLKVNFIKSSIFGVNVDEGFLEGEANFLCCTIGDILLSTWAYRLGLIQGNWTLGNR